MGERESGKIHEPGLKLGLSKLQRRCAAHEAIGTDSFYLSVVIIWKKKAVENNSLGSVINFNLYLIITSIF